MLRTPDVIFRNPAVSSQSLFNFIILFTNFFLYFKIESTKLSKISSQNLKINVFCHQISNQGSITTVKRKKHDVVLFKILNDMG